MNKRRYSLLCMELRKLLITPKAICVLLSAMAINITYLAGIHEAIPAKDAISLLTPMLLLLSSPQIFPSPHFFMSVFVFFLLAQIPFTGRDFPYHMIRTDKKKWIKRQIHLIVLANIVLFLFFFLTSVIALIPHLSLSIEWNNNLLTWQDEQIGIWYTYIPYAVIHQVSLVQAFLCATCLWILYGICGGLLLLLLRFCVPRVKNAGLGIIFCMYFYDYLCEYNLPYVARFFSPVALSRITFLNWGYDPVFPSVLYAFLFFGVTCIVLILITMNIGKSMELDRISSRIDR